MLIFSVKAVQWSHVITLLKGGELKATLRFDPDESYLEITSMRHEFYIIMYGTLAGVVDLVNSHLPLWLTVVWS